LPDWSYGNRADALEIRIFMTRVSISRVFMTRFFMGTLETSGKRLTISDRKNITEFEPHS